MGWPVKHLFSSFTTIVNTKKDVFIGKLHFKNIFIDSQLLRTLPNCYQHFQYKRYSFTINMKFSSQTSSQFFSGKDIFLLIIKSVVQTKYHMFFASIRF